MKTIAAACLAVVFALSLHPAEAANDSMMMVKDIQNICESAPDSDGERLCNFYILGFMNMLDTAIVVDSKVFSPTKAPGDCIPLVVSPSEAKDVFLRTVRSDANGDLADQPATVVLYFALASQFPCHQ